jgi:hypothetical protein
MRPGTFSIDAGAILGPYPGYADGQEWNGWAWPYFTREVADQIAAEHGNASYHEATDTYSFYVEDDGHLEDIYEVMGEDHVVDGVVMHLYAIGAGEWTWDDEGEWPR